MATISAGSDHYDVLICGAGLAGLTLARQLKLEMPDISVAILDRLAYPLREAAHKVGESSNELTAFYLGKTLGLERYLIERQLVKFSLRYFFGDSHGPFEDRPEIGVKVWPPMVTGYQLDRGRLENDLRRLVAEMGVVIVEDCIVDDIVIAPDGGSHQVRCRSRASQEMQTYSCQWVIDALGRRRLLQSKLGLMCGNSHSASSAWWRIEGRIDVTEIGRGPEWRKRVSGDRYLSTNHLMGRGYWVWLIPLSSGATSIGIVTDETIHPFRTYGSSYTQALAWIAQHEPSLLPLLESREPLDFHGLKNYSYHSRQLFSSQRWCCVGEAGIFLDPFYSVGGDFIAIGNTISVELIRRDFEGSLTPTAFDEFNALVLDLLGGLGVSFYRDAYKTFGHAHIFAAKLAWDTAIYWSIMVPLFVQKIVSRPSPEIMTLIRRYTELNLRVQRLFGDWCETVPPRLTYTHADLTRMRLHQMLYLELFAHRTPEQTRHAAQLNLDRLEELAQVLFWQAVAECSPDIASKKKKPPWINAWRITLDPARWQDEGIFCPTTQPRSLRGIQSTFAGIFGPMTIHELLQVEAFYKLRHFAGGGMVSAAARFLLRHFIQDKAAFWIRRFYVNDYPSRPIPPTATESM
ncbi:MAG: tryptophan 7-halogenase [Terracidiphilus sp.]